MNLKGVSKNYMCIFVYGFEKGSRKDKRVRFFFWVLGIVLSIEVVLVFLCFSFFCEIFFLDCKIVFCE